MGYPSPVDDQPSVACPSDHTLVSEAGADLDLLRALVDHSNDLIVRADGRGVILYVSPACRALGYEPSELIGRAAADLVHPEDWPRFATNSAQVFSGEPIDRIRDREIRYRRKDGSWVWLEGSPHAIRDASGQVVELLNVFRDVTERRRLMEIGAEQVRFEKLAKEVAGVGYWRLDARTQQITWSDQMFLTYGFTPGAEPPLDLAMGMVHPDDQGESNERLRLALETGQGWTDGVTRLIRPNGEVRYVEGRAICERDDAGAVTVVFGTMIDVTDRKRAEIGAAEANAERNAISELFENAFRHAAVGKALVGLDGRFLKINPAFCKLIGYAEDEALALDFQSITHPEDLAADLALLEKLTAGEIDSYRMDKRYFRADQTVVWIDLSVSMVTEPDGRPKHFIAEVQDLTARKALEEALTNAKAEAESAAAVKSEFLSNMSHELRTPLTSILGFSSLLSEEAGLTERGRRAVERVSGSSQALMTIINDILDFSKLESGQVEIDRREVDPRMVLRGALELLEPQAQAKGLALHFRADAGLPPRVSLDDGRLRQILLNIVGNAVKFTAEGSVTLSARYDPTRERLRCEVIDTGAGIAPDRLDRLFKRFSQVDASTTRAFGGTGLGLAICKGLVEAMDGEIGVTSEPGNGACFWFELPCPKVVASTSTGDDAPRPDEHSLEGLRILVTDDNPVNRELVRVMLTLHGVEVTEAQNGAEAVALASQEPFDIILMDVRMPVMDGPTAAARIREGGGPNDITPMLAFTANGPDEPMLAGSTTIFDDVISKPISPTHLILTVDRWAQPVFAAGAEARACG